MSFSLFPGTSDTINSGLFVKPSADAENAITVKRPSATWGVGQTYGKGQAFEYLKDAVSASDIGYTGVTPDDFILYRITADGSVGVCGNLHVATGLRQPSGYASGSAIFVNPNVDAIHLVLKTATGLTQAQPFITANTPANQEVFRLAPSGNGTFGKDASARGLTVGDMGFGSGYMGLAHSSRANATEWALLQGPNGDTFINCASGQTTNIRVGNVGVLACSATQTIISGDIRHLGSNVGFFNTAVQAKKTVTGSRGGNAALASLLTQLAGYGLLTDSSTA
jgi:hypothetical protein